MMMMKGKTTEAEARELLQQAQAKICESCVRLRAFSAGEMSAEELETVCDCCVTAEQLGRLMRACVDIEKDAKKDERERTRLRFEAFWAIYPKRVKRKKAEQIWEKLNPDDEETEVILKAVEAQRRSRKWREGYVPDPTTWLNGELWNDEIEQEPVKKRMGAGAGYQQHDVTKMDFSRLITPLD